MRKLFIVFATLLSTSGLAMAEDPSMAVTQKNDRFYLNIPDALLNREVMVVNRLMSATEGSSYYADDLLGSEKVISFGKDRNTGKISLYLLSFAVYAPDSSAQPFMAAQGSNARRSSRQFDIASAKDHASLIDVTDWLKEDGTLFNSTAGYLESIRVREGNIEVTAMRKVGTGPGLMEVNTSMILLPATPMHARRSDRRVGYFTTGFVDPSSVDLPATRASLVCRWRLEQNKPIVFYIDPATPKAWVPYIIQGINDWQPVFRRIGFDHAIEGREAPVGDTSWRLATCRAAIVYKPSPEANAFGPNIHDPRSGEIIQAHVNFFHNVIAWLQAMYMIQASPSDTGARHPQFDDALMGRLIRCIITHEVGHTLGLTHNFGASARTPVDKLRDSAWVAANGHTVSIMDYARFNYVAQPEDGLSREAMMPHIGAYDRWAIEWAYKPVPSFSSPEEETSWLDSWVTEHSTDPKLVWGDGESPPGSIDPRDQTEDLGDDPVKAGEYGIRNLQFVIRQLKDWTKSSPDALYLLRRMYREMIAVSANGGAALGQFSHYMDHVAASIGGLYYTPRGLKDSFPVFSYGVAAKQRAAVEFLNRELFTTPYWLLDTAILLRTGDNPLMTLKTLQGNTFIHIFARLGNMYRAEAALSSMETSYPIYRVTDLLHDLRRGVWTELDTHQPVTIYRRYLQNQYLSALGRVLSTPDNSDVYRDLSLHLQSLEEDARQYLSASRDERCKAHVKAVLLRIHKLLYPQAIN